MYTKPKEESLLFGDPGSFQPDPVSSNGTASWPWWPVRLCSSCLYFNKGEGGERDCAKLLFTSWGELSENAKHYSQEQRKMHDFIFLAMCDMSNLYGWQLFIKTTLSNYSVWKECVCVHFCIICWKDRIIHGKMWMAKWSNVRDNPRSRGDQHIVSLPEFPEEIVGRVLCKTEIQAIISFFTSHYRNFETCTKLKVMI